MWGIPGRWVVASSYLIIAAAAACGGGKSSGPTPTISIAASSSVLSVTQGGSANVDVAVARAGGFSGSVSVSVTGLPVGVTAVATPASLSSGVERTTVSFSAVSEAAVGTSAITVRATGAGVAETQATIALSVTAAPAYALSVSPNALSVVAGASVSGTITVTRTNFSGDVALSVVSSPAGVSAQVSPSSTSGTNATLTINTAPSVATGSLSLGIKGTAPGLADRTVIVPLSVSPPPSSIAIALTPPAATVAPGGSSLSTVSISRSNYTGAVTLGFGSLPSGVTASVSGNGTTGATALISFAATAGASAGTYPIVVTASGSGVTATQATYTLTVVPATGSVVADWKFCAGESVPTFLAYQDGNGPWRAVTPTTTGNITGYRFTLTQAWGGVAVITSTRSALVARPGSLSRRALASMNAVARVAPATVLRKSFRRPAATNSQSTDSYETQLTFASAVELAQYQDCVPSVPLKSVSAVVDGLASNNSAVLSLGSTTTLVTGTGAAQSVRFDNVEPGALTLVGSRRTGTGADRMLLQRNVDIPNGGVVSGKLDFESGVAFAAASAITTVQNSLGDSLKSSSALVSADGREVTVFEESTASTDVSRVTAGLPQSRLIGGELLSVSITGEESLGGASGEARSVTRYVNAVSNQTLALPPRLPALTIGQVTATGYPRLQFRASLPQEYRGLMWLWVIDENLLNGVSVFASGSYMSTASSGALDVTMPDLVGLPGFPIGSRLLTGDNTVLVVALGSDIAGSLLVPGVAPSAGNSLWTSVRVQGVLIP